MGVAEKLTSQSIAARLDELPTLPTVVYELSRVINDPMSSVSEVEDIMASDQALSTKVLKLANSTYYAIPGGVTSLQRAIAYIGYDTIHQLVLSTSIIKALDVKASDGFNLNQFWKHSLGVAIAAETTARFVHYKSPSDLFTCGLVHDMGKVAIAISAPEMFAEVTKAAKDKGLSFLEAEDHLETPNHTLVGRDLAVKWRLPSVIQASIAHHHQRDTSSRGGISAEANLVVDIVFVSNLLIHALQFGNSGHTKVLGVPREVLDRLQISQEQLKDLIAKIKQSIASADGFLAVFEGGS